MTTSLRALFLLIVVCLYGAGRIEALRYNDIACARVEAVHSGEYSFTVDIAVQRVRALRCVLTVRVERIPARGTRYGDRSIHTCFADGLGCIAFDPPVEIHVDVDLPTYERTVVEVPILSQFDDNARTVPFTHLAMQVTEGAPDLDPETRSGFPLANWVPLLTGFGVGNSNSAGLERLRQSNIEMLITVFSPRSSFIADIDETISPKVFTNSAQMFPTVSPQDMMQMVYDGGRRYEFIRGATKHFLPWVNDTRIAPANLRIVLPFFDEIVLRNAKTVSAIDRFLEAGFIEDDVFELIVNSTETFTNFFSDSSIDVFVDGIKLEDLNDTQRESYFFPSRRMKNRVHSCGLGLLSGAEWEAIIGHKSSAWEPLGCEGSSQCSLTGISVRKHDLRLQRSIPFHVSSSEPTCVTMRPRKNGAEIARTRIGVNVRTNGVTHAEVNTRAALASQVDLHDISASSDPNGLLVRILTDENSVPGFLYEPSDELYMLNCFAFRDEVATEVIDENPYIRSEGDTAMVLLEHQRGVLVLPTARTEHNLGSGCGSMNFGMAYWRHMANRMQHAAFNTSLNSVDFAPGKKPSTHHEAHLGSFASAFSVGGHACIPTGTCSEYTPASLFRDELVWLRSKGALPPRFPPLDVNAPDLQASLKNTKAYVGTPQERENFLLKDVIPNIKKPFPKPIAGCGHPTGKPMTMGGSIWQSERQNMWVASNRHGGQNGRKLFIEDTHVHLKNRITHGVSFKLETELKLAHFNHVHVDSADSGCVYLPATTLTSDPNLACAATNPRLAGTAFANIVLGPNEASRELILVVECVGPAFCPLWLKNESVITDAETGDVVPAVITTASDGSLYPIAPILRLYLDRLLPNGTIGNHGLGSAVYDKLKQFPTDGPILSEHLIFRFNQTVAARQYAWEAQGSGEVRSLLPNRFTRDYFVQLYSGTIHQAISDVASFNCHKTERCRPRPFIPPQCIPKPPVLRDDIFMGGDKPPREACTFLEIQCQFDNKDTQFLWALLITLQFIFFVGLAYGLYKQYSKIKASGKIKTE